MAEIVLGYMGPLTGEASEIGQVNKIAAELAVEDVNKTGGINGQALRIIYEDDACNADQAMLAAKKLIDEDNVPVIIGGLSSEETHSFIAYAMEKRVIVFSPGSSSPIFRGAGKYFFRSYPSDVLQGKFAADYAYSVLGARRIAVMYHGNDYGVGVKTAFEARMREHRVEVVGQEVATLEEMEFGTHIEKIKADDPDLVFVVMHPEGAAEFLVQAHNLDLDVAILGADGFGDPVLQKRIGDLRRYLFLEVQTPPSSDFADRVRARGHVGQIPLGTAETYDNIRIIADLIAKVGMDPDELVGALHELRYRGVSGELAFDDQGDLVTAKYGVKEIKDGKVLSVG